MLGVLGLTLLTQVVIITLSALVANADDFLVAQVAKEVFVNDWFGVAVGHHFAQAVLAELLDFFANGLDLVFDAFVAEATLTFALLAWFVVFLWVEGGTVAPSAFEVFVVVSGGGEFWREVQLWHFNFRVDLNWGNRWWWEQIRHLQRLLNLRGSLSLRKRT